MELNRYTKDDLNGVSQALFKRRLSGNKVDFIRDLKREFSLYGNENYNDILFNIALLFKRKEDDYISKSNDIIMLKHIMPYELFLYKYHLGYKALLRDYSDKIERYVVEYDCLFDNQFNTGTKRILEWDYKIIIPSIGYKKLQEKRDNTFKCGFCGKQYHNNNIKWCTACSDSLYLEKNDYSLLELKPVSFKGNRDKNIPAEMVEYILHAQTRARKKEAEREIVKQKENLKKDIEALKREALIKEFLFNDDSFLFLHGLYIYYKHSNTLSFEWGKEKLNDSLIKTINDNKERIEKALDLKIEF